MPRGVFAVAIARVKERRRRRSRAGEGPIITHIDPYPAGDRLAFGQNRDRRVVAVKAFGAEDVPPDQLDERGKAGGAGADPIGQGRYVEIDALTGIAFALPVQRLVFAELGVKDHRQQARARAAAGNDVERRRRLGDPLAAATGETLPPRLDYPPPSPHALPR